MIWDVRRINGAPLDIVNIWRNVFRRTNAKSTLQQQLQQKQAVSNMIKHEIHILGSYNMQPNAFSDADFGCWFIFRIFSIASFLLSVFGYLFGLGISFFFIYMHMFFGRSRQTGIWHYAVQILRAWNPIW